MKPLMVRPVMRQQAQVPMLILPRSRKRHSISQLVETTVPIIVTVNDDQLDEGNETFTIKLTEPSN